MSPEAVDLLAFLSLQDDDLSTHEIAREVAHSPGIAPDLVVRALQELKSAGLVDQLKSTKWELTEEGTRTVVASLVAAFDPEAERKRLVEEFDNSLDPERHRQSLIAAMDSHKAEELLSLVASIATPSDRKPKQWYDDPELLALQEKERVSLAHKTLVASVQALNQRRQKQTNSFPMGEYGWVSYDTSVEPSGRRWMWKAYSKTERAAIRSRLQKRAVI